MFKILFGFFLLVFLSPSALRRDQSVRKYWIVWNVGQGQWSSWVDESFCHHFDMGGERNPLSRVSRLCHGKRNFISLSHWDWDHIGFLQKARKKLHQACIAVAPLGASSARKTKILASYAKCHLSEASPLAVRKLTQWTEPRPPSTSKKNSNDLSHVFLVQGQILIPGDSTSRQEKIWSENSDIGSVRFLLLGHHGSRTSSSMNLLSRLGRLKIAVASARLARYGHPHQEVVRRLTQLSVPILKTEDWGNIWFEMKPTGTTSPSRP